MPQAVLSPRALALRAALYTILRPRLAQDQKLDLNPVLLALRKGKSLKEQKPVITRAINDAVQGKLAQDTDIEDVANFLDAIENLTDSPLTDVPELPDEDRDQLELRDVDDDGREELVRDAEEAPIIAKIREFLKGVGLSNDVLAQFDQLVASEDEPEDVVDRDKDGVPDKEEKDMTRDRRRAMDRGAGKRPAMDKEKMPAQPAMDAAAVERLVNERVQAAQTRERENAREVQVALRQVRPIVGEINIACDSAPDVYGAALSILGHSTKNVPREAYKAMFEIAGKAAQSNRENSNRRYAQDAALPQGTASFAERFPQTRHVTIGS